MVIRVAHGFGAAHWEEVRQDDTDRTDVRDHSRWPGLRETRQSETAGRCVAPPGTLVGLVSHEGRRFGGSGARPGLFGTWWASGWSRLPSMVDLAAEDLRWRRVGAARGPGRPAGWRRRGRQWTAGRGRSCWCWPQAPGLSQAPGRAVIEFWLARSLQRASRAGPGILLQQLVRRAAGPCSWRRFSAQGAGAGRLRAGMRRPPRVARSASRPHPGANLAVLASRAPACARRHGSLIVVSEGGYVFADDDRCWG